MKIGYEYQAINTDINDFNPSYGQDNYAGTVLHGSPGRSRGCLWTTYRRPSNLADFLFGNRSSYSLTNFFIASPPAADQLHVLPGRHQGMPNLTVNAGLRYELATPQ